MKEVKTIVIYLTLMLAGLDYLTVAILRGGALTIAKADKKHCFCIKGIHHKDCCTTNCLCIVPLQVCVATIGDPHGFFKLSIGKVPCYCLIM